MLLRAIGLLLALGAAGCAAPPPADGRLADSVRGLWVQSRPAVVMDTLPARDGAPATVRPRTVLWASFQLTDSTLTREGIDRVVADGDTIVSAGGSRRAVQTRGRVLTLRVDTLAFTMRLAVRGDSLTVTHDDGSVQRYGRADSPAPSAVVGAWVPVVPSPDMPGTLHVLADGTLRVEPDATVAPDEPVGLPEGMRVRGSHIVWGRYQHVLPLSVEGAYWSYDSVLRYSVDGDRLTVYPEYDPPVVFRRADG